MTPTAKKVPILDRSVEEIVRSLRHEVHRIERSRQRSWQAEEGDLFSSGCAALDRLLPRGGFARGTLVEWLSHGGGSGAGTLAMIAAREAAWQGGAVVVMDRRCRFYPPAAAGLGVDLEQVIVVRAANAQEEIWALEQALQCTAVAAVWVSLEEPADKPVQGRWLRRLQLAAESGGSLGLLLRPASVRGQPCWCEAQLLVEPWAVPGRESQGAVARRLRVELTRCHGGSRGGTVELEIDEVTGVVREMSSNHGETHPLHLAAGLAHPAAARRSARA